MDEQARRAERVRQRQRRQIRTEKINIVNLDARVIVKIQNLRDRLDNIETTMHDLQTDLEGIRADVVVLEGKAVGFKAALENLDARVTALEHS